MVVVVGLVNMFGVASIILFLGLLSSSATVEGSP